MDKILKNSILAAKSAGYVIMNYYQTKLDVTHKSPNNPVTKADYEANEVIKKILTLNYPDYGWLSEETKDSPERLKFYTQLYFSLRYRVPNMETISATMRITKNPHKTINHFGLALG